MLKRIIFILIVLGLIAGGGIYYYQNYGNEPVNIIKLYGNIDIREADLGFRVSGRLKKLYFEEGDRVKTGDVLAILDQRPFLDAMHAAKADVEQKKVAYQNAIRIADRKVELLKSKFVSTEETEAAQTTRDQDLAALNVSKANLDTANTNLADTVIYSPSDGMILSRVKEPGTILNVGDIVYVLALDVPIWARVYISETDLGRIYLGMKAKIYTDSNPTKPYEAQIGFISPVSEFTPKTVETEELRTKLVYRLRVIISNPDRFLRQGMPVTVVIDTSKNHAS
jgi:HlyD family secretion protein